MRGRSISQTRPRGRCLISGMDWDGSSGWVYLFRRGALPGLGWGTFFWGLGLVSKGHLKVLNCSFQKKWNCVFFGGGICGGRAFMSGDWCKSPRLSEIGPGIYQPSITGS